VFCQLLGWTYPAEPRSRDQFTQLFHPDEVQDLLAKFDAVFDGQVPQVEALFRLRHSEGRWVWVLTRGRVLERDACGQVRRYSGIFIEITRQRELELRDQEKQKVLQQYFENSVDPICITDFRGHFRTVNPAMYKILGYSAEEFQSHVSFEILHLDDWKATEAVIRRLEMGERIAIENRLRAKDGTYRTFSWHAIADERRELIYCSVRDVTEQRSAEMKAVDAARLASLGEMASGIAHEINNPLAIIKGKCEVMLHQLKQQKFEPAQVQVDLGKIVETVERISRIVQALRVIARDSKNEELSQGNIHQIVDEVLAVSAERFRHSGIELRWSPATSATDDAFARCRPVQVGQVILNLLNNSFDAVTTLPQKWVKIEVRRQDAWVEISVTDSGKGIPTEVLPRLMQPFFTTKGVGRGTGIGLSVSKSMIESQGGKFFYDDKSPHTRFVVQLALR
jgi:PAS domain S-box-containing protein